jgi:hypothetical protein
MPSMPAVGGADADQQCCRLLAEGQTHGMKFEDLAARCLPLAAVALARLEAGCPGGTDLGEADGTTDGGSYLHAAAAAGAGSAVLEALLAAGCALDAADDAGDTALHVAARAGCLVTVRALVAAGADALARNGSGRTPRAQSGVSQEAKAILVDAEEACRQRRAAKQAAVWDERMRSTQTASALRTGCV